MQNPRAAHALPERQEVRIGFDLQGNPLTASVVTYAHDGGTYVVHPEFGPFDSVEEVVKICQARLVQQLTLW